ncbi:MAG: SDR family oxidoreductase [Clostridiales bacterium]
MNIDLTGKTALITGATGQLGRVITICLAECGADTIIHYMSNKEKAISLKSKVESLGKKAMIINADITKYDQVMNMKKSVKNQFKNPDIIIANAVIQYKWQSILKQRVDDYVSQFESSVMQNIYLIKAFVPEMIKKNYGRIIGINTECSVQNFQNQSAYVAGKRGMDGIYRVLSREIGEHQITVNQVAPGWIICDKDRSEIVKSKNNYEEMVPLKRRGVDREVANVVAFLSSDLASFITGTFIPVAGGNVMTGI